MKNKVYSSLWKDIFRTIKKTWTRFLAIAAMTGLSAMVFIGLSSGVPNLRAMIVDKAQVHNMHDIKISSFTGIRPEDRVLLEGLDDENKIEYFKSENFDVLDDEYSIKLFTLTEEIDTYEITQGRLPEADNEIALDSLHMEDKGNNIGQTISFENKKGDNDENLLKEETFEIVGYVDSIEYIENSRAGNGETADYFAVVSDQTIVKEYPDAAIMQIADLDGLKIESNAYQEKATEKVEEIKDLFEGRPVKVEQEIIDQANQEIADAEKEIADGKQELEDARLELENARLELEDARQELEDGAQEIADARQEIAQGQATLDREIADARQEIADGQAQLDEAKVELEQARLDYQAGLDAYNEQGGAGYQQLVDSKAQLDQALEEIELGQAEYDAGVLEYNNGIASVEAGQDQLDQGRAQAEAGLEEIQVQRTNLQEQLSQLQASQEEVQLGLDQVEEGIRQAEMNLPEGTDPNTIPEIVALYEQRDQLQANLDEITTGIDQVRVGLTELETQEDQVNESLEVINQEQISLNTSIEILAETKDQLDQAKAQLDQARLQYDQGLAEYNKGLAAYESETGGAKEELDAALAQIEAGQAEIDQNQADLDQALATLNSEQEVGQKELNDARQEISDAQATYQQGQVDYEEGMQKYLDGLREFEEEEPGALQDIANAEEEIADVKQDLEELRIPLYRVEGKYDDQTFFAYISQADSLNNLSIIFTAMFYLVAILVTLTTILRMVEMERTQIGTMKALGYSRRTILIKYLFYGLSATIIGVILGVLIGHYLLMPPVINAYVSASNMENNPMIFKWTNVIIITIVSLGLIGFTIVAAIGKNMQENAASLMRPKPPKKAKRIFMEKIPFLWSKLSFLNKVSFRNVMRHKVRMLMTILGVAGSFGLIAMAFGLQGSITRVGDKQFNQVYQYDAQVIYDDSADDFEDLKLMLDSDASDYMPVIMDQASMKNKDGMNESLTLVATDNNGEIHDYINLHQRGDDQIFEIVDDKIIISEKLSTSMDVEVGDRLNFIDSYGKQVALEISGITEQYFGHQVYMNTETYSNHVNNNQEFNTYLVKFDNLTDDQIDNYGANLSDLDATVSYIPMMDLEDTLDSIGDSLRVVIVLVIGVSALLTFIVLYNLTNINISERIREIATIEVLGFRPGEVASYIFKENYILTFIGMLVGIVFAKIMHLVIVYSLSPGAFLFDPYLNPWSYLLAALLVLFFTILVMLSAKKTIQNIDMVEALKGVE